MKKFTSILLTVISLMIIFCGCGSKEEAKAPAEKLENKLLPYNLEFGMSYDEAKKVCEDFPEIEEATANDGYASKTLSPDFEEYEKFFGINSSELYADTGGIVLAPAYYFSFNESKKLYEFCVMTSIYGSENSAEVLFNDYIEYYEEKIEEESEIEEFSDTLCARWETNTLKIEVVLSIDGDDYLVYTVVHNKEYELSE